MDLGIRETRVQIPLLQCVWLCHLCKSYFLEDLWFPYGEGARSRGVPECPEARGCQEGAAVESTFFPLTVPIAH